MLVRALICNACRDRDSVIRLAHFAVFRVQDTGDDAKPRAHVCRQHRQHIMDGGENPKWRVEEVNPIVPESQ